MKARLALLATMCVAVVLNACRDITNLQATVPTSVDHLSVWALSGTPADFPSGVSMIARQSVRVDAFASFDVAFDIDTIGRVVIYPVKLVVSIPGGTRVVGMQRVNSSFATVFSAPTTGFEADSGLVMSPGQVVIVESPHNGSGDLCQFAISPNLYAKFSVDSVDRVSRMVFVRMGFDPNCGFRSFIAGIPTS